MRYGIFSDVHGNWEALQEVLQFYRKEGIHDYICLGDIVGYGANPKECLDQIRGLNAVCIAGNHDWAVSGRLNYDVFHESAQEAVDWTRGQLAGEDLAFLNCLPLMYKNDDFVAVHGTLSEPENFHYMIYMSDARETFHLMERQVCFVGHSHVPQIIIQHGEKMVCSAKMNAEVDPAEQYIVNVGSVGQPRDGNPKASCCVYDTVVNALQITRLTYDVQTACTKILKAGLPEDLAERLLTGM
jgi:predicted phosphodiesterase